jgi:hypothetical protein
VILEIKGISKLSSEKITMRFFKRSLDLRIEDIDNNNYIFGVPRTQCSLNSEESRFIVKEDRLTIWIRKVKKEDNWFSLHKVKTIGGGDSDEN